MEAKPAPPDSWLRRILREPLPAYLVGLSGITGGEAGCLLEIWAEVPGCGREVLPFFSWAFFFLQQDSRGCTIPSYQFVVVVVREEGVVALPDGGRICRKFIEKYC